MQLNIKKYDPTNKSFTQNLKRKYIMTTKIIDKLSTPFTTEKVEFCKQFAAPNSETEKFGVQNLAASDKPFHFLFSLF